MKKRKGRRSTVHDTGRGGVPDGSPAADPPAADPPATAEKVAEEYVKETGPEANRRMARRFLFGVPSVAVGIPILFYLEYGVVDSFALSFTAFMVVLCLLVAVGFYYADKPEYHTTVGPKGGVLSYVGGFWFVACAFGPFFGWIVTTPVVSLTEDNWWWRYATRAVLCVCIPVLTALPLFIYVRGKGWFIMLLLLLGVTSLPVWSGVNTLLDLKEGPVVKQATGYYNESSGSFYPNADGRPFKLTMLSHTQRSIKIEPASSEARKE
jgi:hypothetical protein